MKEANNLEKSLMIKEPETIFSRVISWIKNLFVKTPKNSWETQVEPAVEEKPMQEIMIPKAVKLPVREIIEEEQVENSLEYLYKLSDEELDDLSKCYDKQMEEAKNEFLKLENILESYKQSIKKLQGQVESEEF